MTSDETDHKDDVEFKKNQAKITHLEKIRDDVRSEIKE